MAVSVAAQQLDQNLASIEKTLNIFGYIPIVSSVTALMRIQYGKVEIIASLAIAVIKFIGSCFVSDQARKAQLETEAAYSLIYAKHGFANIARGLVEFVPLLNLYMIAHDHMFDRMCYPAEVLT